MRILIIVLLLMVSVSKVSSQSQEVKQLLLNVEKLAQFKKILQNMYDGYKILHTGYTTIKNISEGNFSLHKSFLDALLQVSPMVRKYKRVADIIEYQLRIVKSSKRALGEFKSNNQFTSEEINYIGKVYSNLLNASLKNLDELIMVITAGQLRMSDDERLRAIDRIYDSITEQFSFLRDFNNGIAALVLQRKAEQADIDMSKRLRGF